MGSEKTVVEEFFTILKSLLAKFHRLEVVGFNIVKFDIPLLTQKGREYTVEPLSYLNELWWRTVITDLKQVSLPLFNMNHYNSLHQLVKKLKKWDDSITSPYGHGDNVFQWYQEGEFDKIGRHLIQDIRTIKQIYATTPHWELTYEQS